MEIKSMIIICGFCFYAQVSSSLVWIYSELNYKNILH